MRHHADGDELERVHVFLPPPPSDPRVFYATAMPWGEEERIRLRVSARPSDFEATGLYAPAGATISVDVQGMRELPTLMIGTYSLDPDDPDDITLVRGMNRVQDPKGGLIYIRYIKTPGSKATLTFGKGAKLAPMFRKDSDPAVWKSILETSDVPQAILQSDRATIAVRRETALKYASGAPDVLLNLLDRAIDIEDDFAGLAKEERSKSRTLMVEHTKGGDVWMYATFYRTAYNGEAVKWILDGDSFLRDGWGPWHELGHMRQQPAWTWDGMGEVTNNMFTRAVERAFKNPSRLDRDNLWPAIRAYLAKPDGERKFQNLNEPLLKLGLLEQLHFAYGDRLFQELGRTVRRNPDEPGDDAKRRDFFVVETCRIAKQDLRGFFDAWGLEYSPGASARIGIMELPLPAGDLSKLEKPLNQTRSQNGG